MRRQRSQTRRIQDVSGAWRQRQRKHQRVSQGKYRIKRHRLHTIRRWGSLIMTNQAAAKALKPRCDRTPNSAKTKQPNSRTFQTRTVKNRAPAAERAAAHQRIARAQMAPKADQQANRKLGRWHGEKVRHDRNSNAAPLTGSEVEIIRTFQCTANHAEPRTGRQEIIIHMIRHKGEQAIRPSSAVTQYLC